MTLKLKEVIKIHIAHAVTGVVFHIAIISSFNSQYANNMKTFKILLLFCVHVHCSEKNRLTNKKIYANLKKSLESIKNSCGEICDQTINTYYLKRLNKKRVWLKSQIIMIYNRIHQSYHGDHKNKSISNFQLFVYIL